VAGRVERAKGEPADTALRELTAFLAEHPDERVIIEWRVEG
jgi:hypothetical protein